MRESERVVVQLHDDGFGPESAVKAVALDAQAPFVPRLDAPERLSEQAVVGDDRVAVDAVLDAGVPEPVVGGTHPEGNHHGSGGERGGDGPHPTGGEQQCDQPD